ncbi:MAG: hypothetical protein GXY33_08680 [Phycisphaerae bacterium]|nr:hypothetical protein [Phycisphaerae bacterium]
MLRISSRLVLGLAVLCGLVLAGGCDKSGLSMTKKDSVPQVSLDGHAAGKSMFKKAVKGDDGILEIGEPVSVAPVFSFELKDPAKYGEITNTIINIFEADGAQAIFAVFPVDQKVETLMKAGEAYNLGAPPDNLKVVNLRNEMVEGVQLQPGTKYKMTFTIAGSKKSDTAVLTFKTQ